MSIDLGNRVHLIWIAGMAAVTLVIGVIVGIFVPVGPWFLWLVIAGLYLGCMAAFINIHPTQGQ